MLRIFRKIVKMPTETGVCTDLYSWACPRKHRRLLPPSGTPCPPCNQLRSFWSWSRPHPPPRQDTTTEEAGETGEVLKGSTDTPASFPALVEKHLSRWVLAPRQGSRWWLGLWGLVKEGSGRGRGRSSGGCGGRCGCGRGLRRGRG